MLQAENSTAVEVDSLDITYHENDQVIFDFPEFECGNKEVNISEMHEKHIKACSSVDEIDNTLLNVMCVWQNADDIQFNHSDDEIVEETIEIPIMDVENVSFFESEAYDYSRRNFIEESVELPSMDGIQKVTLECNEAVPSKIENDLHLPQCSKDLKKKKNIDD